MQLNDTTCKKIIQHYDYQVKLSFNLMLSLNKTNIQSFITMNKLHFFVLALFLSIIFVSCNEKTDVIPNQSEFVNITIPDMYQTDYSTARTESDETHEVVARIIRKDGTEVVGKMRITFPSSDQEKLTKFEMSSNLIEEANLSSDFWIQLAKKKSSNKVQKVESSCIASCQEQYTDKDGNKIEGRGACKAECWAKTAAAVITAAAAVIAVIG